MIPFFGLFVTIGFGMLGIGLRTQDRLPDAVRSLFGGMPLLMSLAFMARLSLFTLVPVGDRRCSSLGYRLGGRPSWRDAFRKTGKGGGLVVQGLDDGHHVEFKRFKQFKQFSRSSSSFGGGSSGGGGASGKW